MNKTERQRNALHLYCERLAKTLNDAGLETKAVLAKKQVDVPWSKALVKELLWRPIQEAMTGKHSTEELNRVEPGDVYIVLDRHISSNFGVHVEWPNVEAENIPKSKVS